MLALVIARKVFCPWSYQPGGLNKIPNLCLRKIRFQTTPPSQPATDTSREPLSHLSHIVNRQGSDNQIITEFFTFYIAGASLTS